LVATLTFPFRPDVGATLFQNGPAQHPGGDLTYAQAFVQPVTKAAEGGLPPVSDLPQDDGTAQLHIT
jgi:hypothetical protein